MEDKYVGKVVGAFLILEKTNKKLKDNHYLYKIKCTHCDTIEYRRYSKIPDKDVCIHINSYGVRKFVNKKHSWKNARIETIFHNMISRCYNQDNESYRFYGEKGIKVCDEWINNPLSFESWAISNGYEDGLTIDRVESDKDYSPDNCRWVTPKYNSKWKSTTNTIEIDGIVDSGRGWSKRLGLGINYINTYIRRYGMEETKKIIKEKLNTLA